MNDDHKAWRDQAAIRIKTNSRRLRITNISIGHTIYIARTAMFPPAVLLGGVVAAMIGGLLDLGWNTIWQWAITIVASILACYIALGLFIGDVVRCLVNAFNTPSQRGEDDSGAVIRVRELTEEEEKRDVDSYTV